MSGITIIAFLIVIAFPAGYSKFVTDKWLKLTSRSFKHKHSEFYKELNLRNGKMVIF